MLDFLYQPWIEEYRYSYTPLCFWAPGTGYNMCRGTQWVTSWQFTNAFVLSAVFGMACLLVSVAALAWWWSLRAQEAWARRRRALMRAYPSLAPGDINVLAEWLPEDCIAAFVAKTDPRVMDAALEWCRGWKRGEEHVRAMLRNMCQEAVSDKLRR